MERLPFVLPDFTRAMWVSDEARETWEPRFQRITEAWGRIEWLSVAAGLRACAVTMKSPERFLTEGPAWVERGLTALPVEIQGVGGTYTSTTVELQWGKPFVFRFVVGAPPDALAFKHAWERSDQAAIGELLGYPPCCYDFFRRVWVDDGMVDTTWPMAVATAGVPGGARELTVHGPAEANILGRWLGLRAVAHLPCRFDCEATVSRGKAFLELGRESGYGAEIDWLLEVLRWPAEWSALHGIAEVKTPVLKLSTRTDTTASRYVVRREGDAYPAEGAQGLHFPYRPPGRVPLTSRPSFRRGLEAPIRMTGARPDWYATDNGFPSVAAMDAAHAPIAALAIRTLAGSGGHVLDLGCGNGVLLQRIRVANRRVVAVGIDHDPARIAHARELSAEPGPEFLAGDLFEHEGPWPPGRRYALAILMPGRLLEGDPGRSAWLRAKLATACDRVLVYAYGDWLTRYGTLGGLAEAAGLRLQQDSGIASAALAFIPSKP